MPAVLRAATLAISILADRFESNQEKQPVTIHLPENLERSILEAVRVGHFATVDDAVAEAVRLFLQQRTPSSPAGPLEPTATVVMRVVFADTLYWIAMTHRKDQWHSLAVRVSRELAGCHLVTTDEVLVEVLAAFSDAGAMLRQRAASLVRNLHQKASVTVRPQTRETFLAGLDLYESRPDKGYSLTDCIPMRTTRDGGITEILTHDAHFQQEGFTLLL